MVDSNKFQAKVSFECSFFETRLECKTYARKMLGNPSSMTCCSKGGNKIRSNTNTTHGKLAKPLY